MQKRQYDQIAAVVLFIFSLVVYFVLIPFQVPPDRLGLSSSFFPKISIIFIALLSIALFFQSRFTAAAAEQKKISLLSKEEAKRVGIIFALMCSYILLLRFLGFFIATPLILGLMLYYCGQTKKMVFWPVVILLTAAIYIVFEYGMKLMLPVGIFE